MRIKKNPRWMVCARALSRRSNRLNAWEFLVWHRARINEYCREHGVDREWFLLQPQDHYDKWLKSNIKRPAWDQI